MRFNVISPYFGKLPSILYIGNAILFALSIGIRILRWPNMLVHKKQINRETHLENNRSEKHWREVRKWAHSTAAYVDVPVSMSHWPSLVQSFWCSEMNDGCTLHHSSLAIYVICALRFLNCILVCKLLFLSFVHMQIKLVQFSNGAFACCHLAKAVAEWMVCYKFVFVWMMHMNGKKASALWSDSFARIPMASQVKKDKQIGCMTVSKLENAANDYHIELPLLHNDLDAIVGLTLRNQWNEWIQTKDVFCLWLTTREFKIFLNEIFMLE